MNINLLLQHEDVYGIIKKLLLDKGFVKDWTGVSWAHSLFHSGELYFSLPRLNVIASLESLKLLEPFLQNRYNSRKPLLRLLQKIYIKLACNSLVFVLLVSDKRLRIAWARKGVYTILGGSSYVKIISQIESFLISVPKETRSGCSVFDFEVDFRRGVDRSIGQLPLVEVSDDRFYVEPFYLYSHGIGGGGYIQSNQKVLKTVERYMQSLHSIHHVRISVDTYQCLFYSQLNQHLQKTDSPIFHLVSLLFERISDFGPIDYSITHGDLQLCNILVNNGRVYLIDWESLNFRATVYDEIVLYSSSRHNLDQLDRFIESNKISTGDIFVSHLRDKYGKSLHKFLYLYYLEELLYRLIYRKGEICPIETWSKNVLSKI